LSLNSTELDDAIRGALVENGIAPSVPLVPLVGGRTNLVFRAGDLVVKLYRPDEANPMFDNSAAHEKAALIALQNSGIAPLFVGLSDSPVGQILVYRHVEGATWQGDPMPVADMLGKLHLQNLPALPNRSLSPHGIVKTGRILLTDESFPNCPPVPDLTPAKAAFIHGDVTANNIIVDGLRLTLIDWQCPRIGDPCEDLAGFLSPAMLTMFGPGALTSNQIESFLNAYPTPEVATRYRTLAPLFHWRMAAYCQWQVRQGRTEYETGLDLELAALADYQNTVEI
jgi:thiamine kinase